MDELKKYDFELAYEIEEADKKGDLNEVYRLIEQSLIRNQKPEAAKAFKRAVIK